jgi:hypothetical protein
MPKIYQNDMYLVLSRGSCRVTKERCRSSIRRLIGRDRSLTDVLIVVIGYYELASTGPAGVNGEPGPAGPQGDSGAAGAKGDTGAPGADATVAITQQSVCDSTDAGAVADELCKIGMTSPGSGHIFFVDYNDQYAGFDYLEAAPVTCEAQRAWSSVNTAVTATQGWAARAVGQGQANTDAILAVFGSDTASNNAAKHAVDLASGVPGGCVTSKDDWFLGSLGEMMLMYTNLTQAGVGGFWADYYWSSSEFSAFFAWTKSFDFDARYDSAKLYNNIYVRPVRAF